MSLVGSLERQHELNLVLGELRQLSDFEYVKIEWHEKSGHAIWQQSVVLEQTSVKWVVGSELFCQFAQSPDIRIVVVETVRYGRLDVIRSFQPLVREQVKWRTYVRLYVRLDQKEERIFAHDVHLIR